LIRTLLPAAQVHPNLRNLVDESGAYQLIRRIGSGPGGPVYVARGASGDVAIRQFQSDEEVGSDLWRGDRERFLAAGHQQMTLTDPSIVPTLEVIDGPQEASVVMSYVNAETLQAALLHRRFSPEETTALLRRAALALDFAHSRGVVHGDLKPSDIFLLPHQELMVGDFAISPRARYDPMRFLPLKLTHGYLSPEHFNFPVALEARSDQYSLAVIAYEMYTGCLPFGSTPDYLTAVLTEEMVPSHINPQLPARVDAPLMRALSRNPAHRFNSCMEFVTDLSANLTKVPDGPARERGFLPVVLGLAALLAIILGFLLFRPGKPGKKIEPVVVARKEEPAPVVAPPPPVTAGKKNGKPAHRSADGAGTPQQYGNPVAPVTRKPKPFPETPPVAAPRPMDSPKGGRPKRPSATVTPPMPVTGIKTQVLSRSRPIQNGTSFAMDDPVMGELGHGDLKAMVQFDGPLPRPRLTIEWTVNGTVTDRQKPVSPNELVEYNNEPIPGVYKVTIRLDGRPVEEFRFRITP
jgi:serine/threonine protein kinase